MAVMLRSAHEMRAECLSVVGLWTLYEESSGSIAQPMEVRDDKAAPLSARSVLRRPFADACTLTDCSTIEWHPRFVMSPLGCAMAAKLVESFR